MVRKLICVLLACFCFSASAVFAKPSTPIQADDEDWVWYEFKARVLMKNYKFFAFKTEEQLKNCGAQCLNKNGFSTSSRRL